MIVELLSRPGATAGAVIFSAIVASIVASVTIYMNRKTTRDRETIVLINQFSWDKDYLEAKDRFIALRDGVGLQSCCEDPNSPDARAVNKVMNHYELLSVGINRRILSSQIYADFYMTRFVKDFEASQSYIAATRERSGRKQLFVQFEALAKKWQRKVSKNGA
jgi:hypothetical protein